MRKLITVILLACAVISATWAATETPYQTFVISRSGSRPKMVEYMKRLDTAGNPQHEATVNFIIDELERMPDNGSIVTVEAAGLRSDRENHLSIKIVDNSYIP